MPTLIVSEHNKEPFTYVIDETPLRIGRNDPARGIVNHIAFDDITVSRQHAVLEYRGGEYIVEDIDSTRGTFVNDQRVKHACLKHGDRISLGRNKLVFEDTRYLTVDPRVYNVKPVQKDHRKTIDLNYLILQRLSEMVVTMTSLSEFYGAVMDLVKGGIKASKGLFILIDEKSECTMAASFGSDQNYSISMVRDVIHGQKSLLMGKNFQSSHTIALRDVQSALCAPLLQEDTVIGAIYLENELANRFGEGELILLSVIANQAVAGIEKVRLNEKLSWETKVRSSLQRFLSPGVAEIVTRDSLDKGEISLKAEKINATIMFTDIVGFTLLSERLAAEEIANLLNNYFSLMSEIVFNHNGTIDKYMGDGLLVIFGAPFYAPDHAAQAVQAAREMLEALEGFMSSFPDNKRFNIRIGINSGEVVAGYMGSPQRMEYSALGEAVIIANRLESLAQPGTIYIGRETYDYIESLIPAEFVSRIKTPKGNKEIEVYRVLTKQ